MFEQLKVEKEKLRQLENKIDDLRYEKNKLIKQKNNIIAIRDQYEEEVDQYEKEINDLKRKTPRYFAALLTGRLKSELKSKEAKLKEVAAKRDEKTDAYYALDQKIKAMKDEINGLPKIEEERRMYLNKQEAFIKKINDPLSEKYIENEKLLMKYKNILEQMSDLIETAEEAQTEFTEVRKLLVKATRWSALDFVTNKGYADYKKQMLVSEANQLALLAQGKRKILQSHLEEIEHKNDINLHMDEFYVVLDFVFDGLYSNLLVQDKIDQGIQNVDQQLIEVDRMVNMINFRTGKMADKLAELMGKRNQYLMQIEENLKEDV